MPDSSKLKSQPSKTNPQPYSLRFMVILAFCGLILMVAMNSNRPVGSSLAQIETPTITSEITAATTHSAEITPEAVESNPEQTTGIILGAILLLLIIIIGTLSTIRHKE